MQSEKELVVGTNVIRKPSKTYFIQGSHLIERDRKTKDRNRLLKLNTEKGYLYFVEGRNLKTLSVLRTKMKVNQIKKVAK